MSVSVVDGLDFPADASSQVFAFVGRRGSGKTYGAGRFIEQLLDSGSQVVILDPVGVWYGLRLGAGGEGTGFDIAILGGSHGDIPLEATAGKVVAQLVAERGLSVVLDVSELTGADQRRFVTDFATELLHAKKTARSAVMVVMEEAQEFAPQQVRPDHARMVGAVEKLVKLGRNFGVGVAMITQRPQAVNKDILNQTECLFAFQLTGPHERKTVAAPQALRSRRRSASAARGTGQRRPAGYEYSGGFRNSLSRLRTLGLIEGTNTGGMRACEVFFE